MARDSELDTEMHSNMWLAVRCTKENVRTMATG